MSNVFSNASFAVLSVMNFHNPNEDNTWKGSTVFVQKKPEADFGNVTVLTFNPEDWNIEDFNVQARFEANIVANVQSEINSMVTLPDNSEVKHVATMSNSAISPKSYVMSAVEVT